MNTWDFPRLQLNDDEDASIAADNFRRESAAFEKLFNREFQQNTLDARTEKPNSNANAEPARVVIRFVDGDKLDASYFNAVVNELTPRLKASGCLTEWFDTENPRALVMEEFNTTGLTGHTENSRAQGESERWAAFFFGEGKVTKSRGNGRAGQGKITYHLASGARSVLVNTVRSGEQAGKLFGKAIFDRTYSLDSDAEWYKRKGYWCVDNSGEQPLPQDSSNDIAEFRKAFSLVRKDGQTGTSFVIPYPDRSLTPEGLVQAVITDFFFAIHSGRLVVDIEGTIINAENLREMVSIHLSESDNPSPRFLDFVEELITTPQDSLIRIKKDWDASAEIAENSFEAGELEKLRTDYLEGKMVGARFPLEVSHKKGGKVETYFDVFLQQPDDIDRTEECYIRSDLVIGEEKTLRHLPGKLFGATVAEDSAISEFLGDTEESSHMKFNSRELKATRKYQNIPSTLRGVRQAMPRLFRLLSGLSSGLQEDLLIDWISVSSGKSKNKKRKSSSSKRGRKLPPKPPPPVDPPPPNPKFTIQQDIDGGIRVAPGPTPLPDSLPISGSLEIAYDRVPGTGNPFKKFHVFEFDLSGSGGATEIDYSGLTLTHIEPNKIYFEIDSKDFELKVTGFSPQKRLRSRIGLEI